MKKASVKRKQLILIGTDIILMILILLLLLTLSKPKAVHGLKVAGKTYSSASIRWSKAENANAYRVYRSEDGKDYSYLGYTADTAYRDEKLTTGKTYYYSIVSCNGLKRSEFDKTNAVRVKIELDAPELKVDTSKGEIRLKYSAVDGAAGYQIIRDGKTVGETDATEFTDAKAKNNKKHSYQVKAFRYKKNQVYSKASNSVRAVLHTIKNFEIDADHENLIFDWDENEYYTSYKLYNGDKLLTETTDTSFSTGEFKLSEVMDIRLLGFSENGKKRSPESTRRIMVREEEMDNEGAIDAACEWGVNIANDNSFTYGTGDRAHRCGCYFCGTNTGPRMNKKGSSLVNGHSYEKTYCCNPFVHACFAHGAGDEKMLKACQAGDSVDMAESSYTKYGNWVRVGKPSIPDLNKGDVLVCKSHVMLYIGDGQIVHAGRSGWDAASITTAKCSSYYGMVKFVMRYTGSGSGTRLAVRDVDKNGKVIEDEDKEGTEEAA